MIGSIVFAAYVVGYLFSWRLIYWAEEEDLPSEGGIEKGGTVFVTGMVALFWPLIIPCWIAYKTILRKPRRLVKRDELEARERHIREMEAKLGIGQPNGKTSWDDVENMQDYQIFGDPHP